MSNDLNTEIIMVLDRSGSMNICSSDVVGGFNSFIEEQKNGKGNARVTLAQFDDLYEMVYDNQPIENVSKLDFHPRGSTALLDAIGKTILSSKDRIKKQRPGPDVVIFVIITDGQENASREFSKEKIKGLIAECEQMGWKFVYLGANQDAFSEAGQYGIAATGTMRYDSVKGTQKMFTSVSNSTSSYRFRASELKNSGDEKSIRALADEDFFSEEDRKKNSGSSGHIQW